MPPPNYQTVRLRAGKHKSPDDGVCVMELASMLARERFSDHPASVCPVVGASLRRYNDVTNDDRRQCLHPYAVKVIGTRASAVVQQARAERVSAWIHELHERRRRWYWLPLRWRALGAPPTADPEILATRAVRELAHHDESIHAEFLSMVDSLIAIGESPAGGTGTPAASDAVASPIEPPAPAGLIGKP